MLKLDDLARVAEDLRGLGVEVCHDFVYGPHGGLEGLSVAEDFYPLWELNLPENLEALERADFAAIQARRGPDWSVEPPLHRRSVRAIGTGSIAR
jgi:hypothetical protein